MRRLDWDGARSQHMHKYPYRERPYHPGHNEYRGRGRGGAGMVPRSPHCYRKMSNSQLREMEMARSEMPHPEKKEKKDLERKTSGVKRVREGNEEKEKASAEGTAGEEGTQSEEKKEKETDEGKEESEEAKEKTEEDKEATKKDTKEEKEEETKEKKKEKETTETDESRDPNIVFPRTALKCHMCDMTKFPNIKAYLSHLGSKNHERIAHVFHSRCAASMDLLIAESKLYNEQVHVRCTSSFSPQLANRRKSRLRGKTRWCNECDCTMSPNPKEHCQSTEHTLVSRYMEVQCCGYVYNRANVEEHRLSMRHLKNQISYDEAQQARRERDKELRAVMTKEEETAFHRTVHEFKKEGMEQQKEDGLEELTTANFPPHDPNKPFGLDMLYKETRYQCDLCLCILDSPRQARYHFRSLEHYHNICNSLTAIEEAKELERKKKEEEEKAAKAAEEEEGKEADKGKTEKTKDDAEEEEEDISNMETVDVAEEDGEGEGEEEEEEGEGEEEEHQEFEEEAAGEEGGEGEEEEVGEGEEEEEEQEEEGGERSQNKANEEEEDAEMKEGTEQQEGEEVGEGEGGEQEEEYDEEMEGEYDGEGEGEEEEVGEGEMVEGLEEEGEDFEGELNSGDEGEGGEEEEEQEEA
ncbi:glutamic acid-rich protein-like [Eriocheir sinensis]|uniref:glutamic acid-rich protein-like n=1 Tax=Eriocheir sinensis TaxID=95602 RepID=UPI0021CAC859|nr:glutamic acid-rich protein-like [Eriocheir sinensis]